MSVALACTLGENWTQFGQHWHKIRSVSVALGWNDDLNRGKFGLRKQKVGIHQPRWSTAEIRTATANTRSTPLATTPRKTSSLAWSNTTAAESLAVLFSSSVCSATKRHLSSAPSHHCLAPQIGGRNRRDRGGAHGTQLARRGRLLAGNARTHMHPGSCRRPALLSCQARIRKFHDDIAGFLCSSFVRTIFTPSTWKQDLAIPRGKAGAEVLLGRGVRVGLDWSSRLVYGQYDAVTKVGQAFQSSWSRLSQLIQRIRAGHTVFRPDIEHLCISSLQSPCNRTRCRSFAFFLHKFLVQLLLHEILKRKLETNPLTSSTSHLASQSLAHLSRVCPALVAQGPRVSTQFGGAGLFWHIPLLEQFVRRCIRACTIAPTRTSPKHWGLRQQQDGRAVHDPWVPIDFGLADRAAVRRLVASSAFFNGCTL